MFLTLHFRKTHVTSVGFLRSPGGTPRSFHILSNPWNSPLSGGDAGIQQRSLRSSTRRTCRSDWSSVVMALRLTNCSRGANLRHRVPWSQRQPKRRLSRPRNSGHFRLRLKNCIVFWARRRWRRKFSRKLSKSPTTQKNACCTQSRCRRTFCDENGLRDFRGCSVEYRGTCHRLPFQSPRATSASR
ncbi:hypothetical protein GGQ79_000511 [Ochrobactrum pecoris]|uniref:Uncharacterized protein n=1 Tax=Brucella pecoris TaxID=867683 RepID=A0AB34YLL8_9HYPH|nr:hypothetical protein [Brucella pecoris]